jgi:hypothetical protein
VRSLLRLRTQRLGGEAEVLVDPQSSCVLRMQVLLGSSMGLPPLPYKMVRFREKSYAFGRNLSQKRPTVVPGPVRKERSDSSRRHVSAAHSPLPALSLAVPASLRWPEGRASPPFGGASKPCTSEACAQLLDLWIAGRSPISIKADLRGQVPRGNDP